MSDAVKSQYQLSNFMSALLSFFVFIAFAVFSVPGGVLSARIGKKKLLLLGLGLNAIACLVPSLQAPSFGLLLGCIFLLGSAPPSCRLRAIQSCGTSVLLAGIAATWLLPRGSKASAAPPPLTWVNRPHGRIALFKGMGWRGTFPLFFVLMAVAFVGVALLKVDGKRKRSPRRGSSLGLLKEPIFFLAVLPSSSTSAPKPRWADSSFRFSRASAWTRPLPVSSDPRSSSSCSPSAASSAAPS